MAIYLKEKVERHQTLNPKLFTEKELLKDQVKEKILQIVDFFTETLEEDGIKILIKDIVIIGSNASYNYTKDSDIDIHIIADTKSLKNNLKVYKALYSAYRSLFNKNFEIDFYGIPVEIYVETEDINTKSNGIYSVKNTEWVKKPQLVDIPEIDNKALAKEVEKWTKKFNDVKDALKRVTPEKGLEKIIKLLEDIYELRKTSLSKAGEYSIGNLTFKELRNKGILDELKDLKNKTASKKLSLESLREQLTLAQLDEYRDKISSIANTQALMQENGYFSIHNVKEIDVNYIINSLSQLDFIEFVQKDGGRIDWSVPTLPFQHHDMLYTINGKVKI